MLRPFTGNSWTARLFTTWLKLAVSVCSTGRGGLDLYVLRHVAELHRYVRTGSTRTR